MSGDVDTAWFDATKAVLDRDKGRVDTYSTRIAARMVPVGCALSDHLLVLLAEDGRFFGGYDDFLTELASDPIDLVESFIDERGATI